MTDRIIGTKIKIKCSTPSNVYVIIKYITVRLADAVGGIKFRVQEGIINVGLKHSKVDSLLRCNLLLVFYFSG